MPRKKANTSPVGTLREEFEARYREIGPPPGDTVQRVEWGNRICAELAYEQLVAPEIRGPQERKVVLEAVRTLGLTAVKALYESRLKRLESFVYGKSDEESDVLDDLESKA